MKYYRVIPFTQSFDTYGLIYGCLDILAEKLDIGDIIQIPFRSGFDMGIFAGQVTGVDINIPKDIKNIEAQVIENISISSQQIELIDFISQYYIVPIHHAASLFFPKNIKEKLLKNTLHKLTAQEYQYSTPKINLSAQQQKIFDTIVVSANKKTLLYGVTGSGKTEIYMKLIEKNLKERKQTLLLIPEIILTSQIGVRLKKVFGEQIIILHSGVSAAKKSQLWIDIYTGNAKIIVGTRSSLFYPYSNLGTIIVDEEHDNSYISDNAPRYNALEVAEKITDVYNIPLLLASGTPKVTTMYRGLKGDFTLLQLLEKFI